MWPLQVWVNDSRKWLKMLYFWLKLIVRLASDNNFFIFFEWSHQKCGVTWVSRRKSTKWFNSFIKPSIYNSVCKKHFIIVKGNINLFSKIMKFIPRSFYEIYSTFIQKLIYITILGEVGLNPPCSYRYVLHPICTYVRFTNQTPICNKMLYLWIERPIC